MKNLLKYCLLNAKLHGTIQISLKQHTKHQLFNSNLWLADWQAAAAAVTATAAEQQSIRV